MTTATKPRLRTKYAMPGEVVRIVTPKMFVCVGYPLCGGDMRMVEPYKEKFDKLHPGIVAAVRKICIDLGVKLTGHAEANLFSRADALAVSILLNEAHFGGKERKVYETDMDFDPKGEWKVLSRKIVQTGVRVAGGASGYYGEDYDPPFLTNNRSHCVYKLERIGGYSKFVIKVLDDNCQRRCGKEWI